MKAATYSSFRLVIGEGEKGLIPFLSIAARRKREKKQRSSNPHLPFFASQRGGKLHLSGKKGKKKKCLRAPAYLERLITPPSSDKRGGNFDPSYFLPHKGKKKKGGESRVASVFTVDHLSHRPR